MKKCKKCNIEKDYDCFTKEKRNNDGLNGSCKDCNKSIMENSRRKFNDKIKGTGYYRKYDSELRKIYFKNWSDDNKDRKNEYFYSKYNNDELFRLKHNIRVSINKSIKSFNITKSSKTEKILGCSFIDLKNYLESKFEPWMNWKNRGLYNGDFNYGWDIDHIIPISSAKSEEELLSLNHYTNLQPLCSKINRDIKKHKKL